MSNELINPISQVLTPIVRAICFHPDDLRVTEIVTGRFLDLIYYPHMADMGKLVGTGGRQAKALAYLGNHMAQRMDMQSDVRVVESYRGEREPDHAPTADPDFGMRKIDPFLWPIIDRCFDERPTFEVIDIGDKIKVRFAVSKQNQSIIQAISDLLFPLGKANGRRIEIKPVIIEEAAK